MDWTPADTWTSLQHWLQSFPSAVPEKPKAILVISGHWAQKDFTVQDNPSPDLIFDYHGFPPHTYDLTWPAQGSHWLSERVRELCNQGHINIQTDIKRGYDHGVFVPLKVAYPQADIPTVALSIRRDYNPAAHIELGRALQPLRDEGVLIIGSGMSFHNLRAYHFGSNDPVRGSEVFDQWLDAAVTTSDIQARNNLLVDWESAPAARFAHPDEDHLLPLMVVAGAAGQDKAICTFHDRVMGTPIRAYRFG